MLFLHKVHNRATITSFARVINLHHTQARSSCTPRAHRKLIPYAKNCVHIARKVRIAKYMKEKQKLLKLKRQSKITGEYFRFFHVVFQGQKFRPFHGRLDSAVEIVAWAMCVMQRISP